jgi:hypothetical protein
VNGNFSGLFSSKLKSLHTSGPHPPSPSIPLDPAAAPGFLANTALTTAMHQLLHLLHLHPHLNPIPSLNFVPDVPLMAAVTAPPFRYPQFVLCTPTRTTVPPSSSIGQSNGIQKSWDHLNPSKTHTIYTSSSRILLRMNHQLLHSLLQSPIFILIIHRRVRFHKVTIRIGWNFTTLNRASADDSCSRFPKL